MAAGLAVVASSTGGSKEIFKDGVNCLTFITRDPNDCARQSVRLLRQPDLLGRIARAGQIDIMENFTLERMLDRIEQHLERVGQSISR
jgi:glycosyltransferase involved in cell wall biosynthesis